MVDVCLAGTGGMMPLKNRWLTCCFMEYNGKGILIDCGEGTQVALNEADCKLSKLDVLLITHFHADHVSGLPGLLLSLGNYSKKTPLYIYGPKGLGRIVENLCCICGKLPYELVINELPTNVSSDIVLKEIDEMVSMKTIPLRHKVPCIGYSFVFSRKPVFNPEKAEALGVPKKMWSILHRGENVEFEGNTYTPDMVIDGERKPVKITYATDSRPVDDIADIGFRSDLLICEGMYGDDDNDESMKEKGHMLISDALRIAEYAEAERLWLTHYSPAMVNPEQYEKQVKKKFAGAVISKDGEKITL